MDEIKIKKKQVWEKHTGKRVGYVDIGDIGLVYVTLTKINQVLSHIMVFLVHGIVNPFRFNLVDFATKDI